MKISTIIIFCIVLFAVFCNKKKELFTNSSSIVLSEHDMYQIKDAINKVANYEYLDAIKKIGENYIKIIIDAFYKSLKETSIEKQKNLFEADSFIQVIFNDEKLGLSDHFKQSLFMELSEARLLNRNIKMVPLRLYSNSKILSKENLKKITENIQNIQLKKISKFFISYLLKYYDISRPQHNKNDKILRFENSLPSFKEFNSLISKSNLFFD
jgi:hypothetical protein